MPQEKEVTLQADGKDMYGRTIADVLLPDGTNVNHTLVKDAWCWWYRKYALGVSATRPRGSYLRVDQLVGVKELELWPNNLGLVNPSSGITKT